MHNALWKSHTTERASIACDSWANSYHDLRAKCLELDRVAVNRQLTVSAAVVSLRGAARDADT